MRDMLETRDLVKECWPVSYPLCAEEELRNQFMPELDLYREAVRKPTSACLEVLLEAGCCSPWICRLAVQEGKPAFLALAALWGCPCDAIALGIAAIAGNLPLLKEAHHAALLPNGFLSRGIEGFSMNETFHITQVAQVVTEEGHAACLAALLEWFGAHAATRGISRKGGVDCLDALERAGCLSVLEAVYYAAERTQVECIQYLCNLRPDMLQMNLNLLSFAAQAREANPEAIIDCMDFLQGCGCEWSPNGREIEEAAERGQTEVLQYCLERVQVRWWEKAMRAAYVFGNLECMHVLYDNGYEQHRLAHGWAHPATLASIHINNEPKKGSELECLRLALRESGKVERGRFPPSRRSGTERTCYGT
eukprot:jgi/Botrbrau1/22097/Bobra.0206s0023.1